MDSKKAASLILGCAAVVGGAAAWYLNRSVSSVHEALGGLTAVYRWGRIAEVVWDRNRDGRPDGREVFLPPVSEITPHTVPRFAWLDQDLDGRMEVAVESRPSGEVVAVRFDSDGDGTFDRVVEGEDAVKERERIRARSGEILRMGQEAAKSAG